MFALLNVAGEIVYLNRAGEELLGVDRANISPNRLSQYIHADDQARLWGEITDEVLGKGTWEGEIRLVNQRTGGFADVLWQAFALRDEAGLITGYAALMADISARKAADQRLRDDAATLQDLITNNPFGVYLVDPEFRILAISQGAQKVFAGIDPLIGRDFGEVIRIIWPEDFAREVLAAYARVMQTGESYTAPRTVEQRANVDAIEAYDWRLFAVPFPDGRRGVVCYFYDLSEREALTRALEDSEARLRMLSQDLERRVISRTAELNQANERLSSEMQRREAAQISIAQANKLEAIGQLTSGIAHDFNNILGGILGAFSLILKRSTDERIRHLADLGQTTGQRGAGLVRQLMAFARNQDIAPQVLDTGAAIAEALRLYRHNLGENLDVRAELDPGLWPIEADPDQLQSALLNLANNARDALVSAGSGKGELLIEARNAPGDGPGHPLQLAGRDAVALTVTDNGPGMAPEVLQRVVEPFFSTKGPGKGTGLGLAMVQNFALTAGGALRITSRLGAGSSFVLYLPRGDAQQLSDAHAPRPLPAVPRDETVLLVDHDPVIREILGEALSDGGFQVIIASNGEDALDQLTRHSIDAMVSDVAMPGISGIELVRRVRDGQPNLPCVFITGDMSNAELKGETVVPKPSDPSAVVAALHALLGERDRVLTRDVHLDGLALRLQSDCTRQLFRQWRDLAGAEPLPDFAGFDLRDCTEPHRLLMAEVDLGTVPAGFTFHYLGDGLADPALAPLLATSAERTQEEQETGYLRCALSGRPVFEIEPLASDPGHRHYERLLLPFSSDGRTVDHLVGAIVYPV